MDKNSFSHLNLLYVEDDKGVRDVTLRFLKRMFHIVNFATNGEEGYLAYQKYNPDLIITDLKMPVMDGLSMVKKIRESDDTTKIIITTAFTEENQLIDAVELNIVRYVLKPLNQRNLIPALEKAVGQMTSLKTMNISDEHFLDMQKNSLIYKDKEYRITKKEFLFLELLSKNVNRTVTYKEIEAFVWNEEAMSVHSLRTMVGSIKKKFALEQVIKNISGIGYILEKK